jgi:hypothetical protein
MSPVVRRHCPRHAVTYTPPATCPACVRQHQAARATRRGKVTARGYGADHRVWAREVLRLHPVCPCGAPAVVADHVVPWRSGGVKYDIRNGQGLCLRCSGRKDGGVRR